MEKTPGKHQCLGGGACTGCLINFSRVALNKNRDGEQLILLLVTVLSVPNFFKAQHDQTFINDLYQNANHKT